MFELGNLSSEERQNRRDQHHRELQAWEQEQRRGSQAQAFNLALERALTQLDVKVTQTDAKARAARKAAQAARRAARKASGSDPARALAEARAARKAAQQALALSGGQKAAVKRGRRENPVKSRVVAEAERRRAAGEPADGVALHKWAKNNFGQKAPRGIRTVRRWISPQRP
jgi:hypothetical protein